MFLWWILKCRRPSFCLCKLSLLELISFTTRNLVDELQIPFASYCPCVKFVIFSPAFLINRLRYMFTKLGGFIN